MIGMSPTVLKCRARVWAGHQITLWWNHPPTVNLQESLVFRIRPQTLTKKVFSRHFGQGSKARPLRLTSDIALVREKCEEHMRRQVLDEVTGHQPGEIRR